MSNLVSQIKPPAQSPHTKEETISTGCALEHQLHRLFYITLFTLPCQGVWIQHIVSSWRRSRRTGLSPKAPPAALQPTCSRSLSWNLTPGRPRTPPPFVICGFCLEGDVFLFVCVLGRLLGRRAAAGRMMCSASSPHTHTHSTVALQLAGSACSLESHTNIPHSPVQRFSFLTRSHHPPPPVPPLLFHTVSVCCKLNPTQQVTWSHIQP